MPPLWLVRTAFRTVGSVAPGVAARWAETIFCSPPRHKPRASEEAFLSTGERRTVRSENLDLAVWSWGKGPRIILTHGWGSRAGRFSTLAGALVRNGFSVVLFDGPAHGASKGRLASLPQFSQALRDVVETVGPAQGLVGHSLGGAAVSLALRRGVRAERVVLLAPPADVVVFSHAFAEHLRLPPRAHEVMRDNLETRLQFKWEELHVPSLVQGLSCPALIVHDRDDADVPYSHGEEVAQAWPGSELFGTTGLGHRALLRDPTVVSRVVEFFRAGAVR